MGREVIAVLLVVLFGAIVGCGNSARAGQLMNETAVRIYYIPFNYETYVPVTTDSIEKDAICVLSISPTSEQADSIRRIIGAAESGKFDDQFVRMKAVGLLPGNLFIDKYGGVRGKDAEDRKLGPDGLGDLKSLLDGLAAAQGCGI